MRSTSGWIRFFASLGALAGVAAGAGADMPLQTSPAWISSDPHVATGGAWADVDGDGWLDLVAANGNDIERQRVVVYHNNGDGTLPQSPTWSSADIDYHGHLDVGDVNGDGHVDIAVALYLGAGGFDYPGGAKVYLNDGAGGFSSYPDWQPASPFYCFSVALGDADGDGDLDLACACGEGYFGEPERDRVFFNDGGVLETEPSWLSDEPGFAYDAVWDDVELDGDADLLFCGLDTPMRLYLNHQTAGGGLATAAGWENSDEPQYGNTTAFGDWNNDGYPEVAVADNFQLGGPGYFKVYANAGGALDETPSWSSSTGGYGSHVSWIDLDLDGLRDLAAGRWWGSVRIYRNTGGDLTSAPDWQSSTTSVIENMFWGDVDNDGLRDNGSAVLNGTGARTFFHLGTSPLRSIDEVLVDGVPVSGYVTHPANGWISLSPPPPDGSTVEIAYSYSVDIDLGVTNWDTSVGNYLFLNTTDVSAASEPTAAAAVLSASPNPMRTWTQIRYRGPGGSGASLEIFDVSGRRLQTLHSGALPEGLKVWEWDGRDGAGRRAARGVYFARMTLDETVRSLKILKVD
ncbi:MAG: T9SS type A sorting domain-containing protein [Candidatus Eisenbacteria bacterium]|nr:T9SS type A sorting domain-containing protein [Candidatus Eisenbacteria bacterium]